MFCPKCKKETNGKADPGYLLSKLGGTSNETLPVNSSETNIVLICEHCNAKWFVKIKLSQPI